MPELGKMAEMGGGCWWELGEENTSFSTLTSEGSIGNVSLDCWIENLLCNVQIGVKDECIILDQD